MKYRLTSSGVITESGKSIPNDSSNRHWREYEQWALTNTPYPDDPGTFQIPVFDWNTGTWSEGETAQEAADRAARNNARAKMRTDHANGAPQSLPGLNASVDAILEILKHNGMMVDE